MQTLNAFVVKNSLFKGKSLFRLRKERAKVDKADCASSWTSLGNSQRQSARDGVMPYLKQPAVETACAEHWHRVI